MPCRVGMTTNLVERRAFWESQYPRTLKNWQVVYTCYTKSDAQFHENRLALAYSCEAAAGGVGPENATWYIYYFEHNGN